MRDARSRPTQISKQVAGDRAKGRMKTIVFHSYKGGVGRTMALLNLARALTLHGKNVVVLDLDIDAPGIHLKLADQQSLEIKGGYIDYLSYFYGKSGTPANGRPPVINEPDKPSKRARLQRLSQYVVDVPPSGQPGDEKEWQKFKLIPAGTSDQNYWWHLTSPWFVNLFAVSRNEFSTAGEFRLHSQRNFFESELEIIRDLFDDGADFFLVDCKSAREYSCVPLYYWADAVVSMFPANSEGVAGAIKMREAIESVTGALRVGKKPVDIHHVVCRVPADFEPTAEMTRIRDTLKPKNGLSIFSEVLRVTIDEHCLIDSSNDVYNREMATHPGLLDDQAKLFAKIAEGISAKEFIDLLTPKDSAARDDVVMEQNRTKLTIINTDKQVNIMLRSASIRELMLALARQVGTVKGAKAEVLEAFTNAGIATGTSFSSQIISTGKIGVKPLKADFKWRVNTWCAYDGLRAGFGKIVANVHKVGARETVDLQWEECFLVGEAGDSQREFSLDPVCRAFLVGYLSGTLEGLLPGTDVQQKYAGALGEFKLIASGTGHGRPAMGDFDPRTGRCSFSFGYDPSTSASLAAGDLPASGQA